MLSEVIIQQAVFELIHRAACLCREFFEPNPYQKNTADMITLDARLAALAAFQPGYLSPFAVQLLDLPAEAAHLMCGFRGILSLIVGHNVVRAVGRHLNPEQLHFVVFGKAFDLDPCCCSVVFRVEGVTLSGSYWMRASSCERLTLTFFIPSCRR